MNTHISNLMDFSRGSELEIYYTFGLDDFDKIFGGIKPGELTTLYGDIASGKTTFTIRLLDYQSIVNRIPSLYFCIRDTSQQIIQRLVGLNCSICWRDVELRKELRSKEVDHFLNKISESPIYLYQAKAVSIEEVCDLCKMHVEEYGVKIVFLHNLYIDGKDKEYKLRLLAKDLDVAIVLLEITQEYGEGFYGVRPVLRSLCYNHLNEFSDIVIGLCDYASYHLYQDIEGRDLRNLIHVELLKGRDGYTNREFYVHKESLHKKRPEYYRL